MFGQASALDPVWAVTLLAGVFTLKHFVADFLLQTNWMACGKDRPDEWFRPLLAHVGCHALLTLCIVLAVAPRLWPLALVDFAIHWLGDRGKTLVGRWGGWTPTDCRYWWLFGLDQFLHQITNLGLTAALLTL